jgi:hypothetical protein
MNTGTAWTAIPGRTARTPKPPGIILRGRAPWQMILYPVLDERFRRESRDWQGQHSGGQAVADRGLAVAGPVQTAAEHFGETWS